MEEAGAAVKEQKHALYYSRKGNKQVQCELCPQRCLLDDGKYGLCKVRHNEGGFLHTLNYNNPSFVAIDHIEKRQLFHFLPGEKTLSVGMWGNTLSCLNCVQDLPEGDEEKITAEQIVKNAANAKLRVVSFTYSEPTLFYEYMLEAMKYCRMEGMRSALLSNGFIMEKPLLALGKFLDAAVIDLKSFDESFYKEQCHGSLKDVQKTLLLLNDMKIHLEISITVVPGIISETQIKEASEWIHKKLGDVPLHLIRFFPRNGNPGKPTSVEELYRLQTVAKKSLPYVYVGNVLSDSHNYTHCPRCKRVALTRDNVTVINKLHHGQCSCGYKLRGVWK